MNKIGIYSLEREIVGAYDIVDCVSFTLVVLILFSSLVSRIIYKYPNNSY